MRMPLNRFYLTTSISYDASTIKQNFKKQIGQSWITICPSLPKHLQSETWFLNGFGDVDPDNPPFYSKLYAVSYARTINQAAEQMLLDINLMVALLNISDPSRIRLRIGKIQPINEIRLGPTQIIHDRHGKIIQDKIWYQAEYQKLHHTKRFYPDSKKLSIWLYKCTKGISKSNIRDLIEPSLRQYNSALDAVDPSISLMKLWSALELLVNSSGKGSKVTAKRASFFSSDIEYRYEKLLYVSDLRNSFVHAGTGMPSALEIVYDLKSYIGSLLLNLILMRPPSLDKESFLELLDLPHEPSKIKRRISTSQLALRLRVNSARHA